MNKSAEEKKEVQKIFVDAGHNDIFGQIILIVGYLPLFIILYMPFIISLHKNISLLYDLSNKSIVVITLSIVGLLPIVYVIASVSIKIKYGIYRKIFIDDSGIAFFGLLKKIHINWNEIIALGTYDRLHLHLLRITLGKIKMAEVHTCKGKYYFPLSVKEKGQEYPAYHYRAGLVDKNENKVRDISPEDCPLYVEIQRCLRK